MVLSTEIEVYLASNPSLFETPTLVFRFQISFPFVFSVGPQTPAHVQDEYPHHLPVPLGNQINTIWTHNVDVAVLSLSALASTYLVQ